jgi:putative transposase
VAATEENAKLRRLVADLTLDKVLLQEVLRKQSEAHQEARMGEALGGLWVEFPRVRRRACRVLGLYRSTCRYVRALRHDLPLRQKFRWISQARPRFGYQRIYVMFKREGFRVGSERVRRLYREEGLSSRLRVKRRRILLAVFESPRYRRRALKSAGAGR